MDEERLVKRKQRAKRDGNVRQIAQISKDLGDIYFETGRLDDALLEYTEQLQACEDLHDKLNCAIAHRMIGEVHASLGDYNEALTHQTLHLAGAKEVQNVLEQQRALATIGRTQFCLGEAIAGDCTEKSKAFSAAKKAYCKSLRLCDQLENSDITLTEMMTMRARLLLNLGLVLEEQKNPDEAIELIKSAAELCKKHKLEEDLHRTYIALSALHERQNFFGLALKHIEMAEIGDSSMKAVARLSKAELLLRIGYWPEARSVLVLLYLSKDLPQTTSQQVQKLLRIVVTICRAEESLEVETERETRLKLYEKLGDASSAVRCYDKAIEYYRGMLACAEEGDSSEQISAALVSIIQTFRDAKNFNEAVPFARRELKLCTEPAEICRSALNLADLLYLTHWDKSSIMEIYDLAICNAQISGNQSLEASVLKDLKVYLEDIADFEQAAEIERKLKLLPDANVDSASEAESDSASNIGADLCLEDLSDVEAKMQKKSESSKTRSSRPQRTGFVIKRNEKGETKLHVACINGNVDQVEKLLDAGHPTNVTDHCGWTPLHEAANHGYVEIATLLIKAGANVNHPGGSMCGGVTPLHDAASCGNLSIMRLLMKEGADLLVKTKEGDSVLDCLEGWRNRVEDLSASDQAEYDNIQSALAAILPPSTKYSQNMKKKPWSSALVDEDDEKSDGGGKSNGDGKSDSEGKSDDDGCERISAGEDYKRTIASLMNRGRLIGSSLAEHHSATPKKKVAPLIDSEQTLVGDWLEDDLDCTVKEKTLVDDYLPSAPKRKSSNSTPDSEKRPPKRQRLRTQESLEIVECTVDEDNSCDSVSNNSNSDNVSKNNRPQTKFSKSDKNRQQRQISLLNAGFTRDSVSRTPSPIFSYTAEATNNFERISEPRISEPVKLHIIIGERIISLKLRFPEQRETAVACIMDDIVEKFEEETGCRIQIALKTMTGQVLLREDTMKNVKPLDGVIRLLGEIVEKNVPPINERYTKICQTHQIHQREAILKSLKNCESTSTFRVKSGEAFDDEMLPLLKSLENQHKLQVLRIANGSLFELGDNLNNTIKHLKTLQELHLEGCDIDYNCLSKIDYLPPQLRVLDLSYNPLGPQSHDTLDKLLSHHRHLQTLNLRFCKLEKFKFSENWTSLVNLDLSWNLISDESSSCLLLQRLQMLSLNISNTCSTSERSSLVREVIDGSKIVLSTLESLDLACCAVTDEDVENILSKAANLSKIVLSGNSKITKSGVGVLLRRSPTLCHIDVSGCELISEVPDSDVYIEHPQNCTLIVSMSAEVKHFWLNLWRGTANAYKLPHNIITFKPILY